VSGGRRIRASSTERGVTVRAYRPIVRSDEIEQVDAEVIRRLRAICAALPEVREEDTAWSHSFLVRRSNVVSITALAGATVLSVRADAEELEAMLATGHPYFATGQGSRVGVVVDADTDWDEIAELVVESYRLLAPKKLVALLPA